MSDDQLPDRADQASAYLDGELEADERAVVENDAETMAMVDSFARIRAELNSVEPVDDAIRSAAIAAALAEFDAGRDSDVPAAAAAAAVVTPLRSRRDRGYRVVMGVAAAVVIAVVGIAALNSTRSNDHNSSTAAVAPEDTTEPPQLKVAANTAAASGVNDAAGAAPAGTAAPAAVSIESASTTLPAINSKQELAAYATSFRSGAAAPAPVPSTTVAAGAGGAATTAAAAGTTPPSGDSSFQLPCLGPEVSELGQILYKNRPAVVVIVIASGIVEARDAIDCSVLETVP